MAQRQKSSRDHTVPQMYLKRWCAGTDARRLRAAPADDPRADFLATRGNVAAETNFYRGEPADGMSDLDLEGFLSQIETLATPAFRHLLDESEDPRASALPTRWPPRSADRRVLSWWLAAQILRTSRQRARLLALQGDKLEAPPGLRGAGLHLEYMLENLAVVADVIFQRPWGIGFCSLCLMTSDVPVQVINAQDDPDQPLAVAYWDVYLPLDPHRFLFLPGVTHAAEARLRRDHRINFQVTYGVAMNELMIETAHRQVFWHPDHDPRSQMRLDEAHSIRRSNGGSQSILFYDTFGPDEGIERRWLTHHVWDADAEQHGATTPPSEPRSESELRSTVQALTEAIEALRERGCSAGLRRVGVAVPG
jgi:hypothetical protein